MHLSLATLTSNTVAESSPCSRPSGGAFYRGSVTASLCPQPDVTGERCRCATTLLAQVAGSKANALRMAALPLQSSSTLCGVTPSSVGPASLSKEASIHPLHLQLRMGSVGCRCLCLTKLPQGSFGIGAEGRNRHFWTHFILL